MEAIRRQTTWLMMTQISYGSLLLAATLKLLRIELSEVRMGDFSEHVLFGFLAGFVVLVLLNDVARLDSQVLLASALAVFIGSVLPDIDNKNAYVHRAVKAFASIVAGTLTGLLAPFRLEYRALAGVAALVLVYVFISRLKIRHRGFLHTLTFSLVTTSIASVAGLYLMGSAVPGVALGIGLLSHLALDKEFRLS